MEMITLYQSATFIRKISHLAQIWPNEYVRESNIFDVLLCKGNSRIVQARTYKVLVQQKLTLAPDMTHAVITPSIFTRAI